MPAPIYISKEELYLHLKNTKSPELCEIIFEKEIHKYSDILKIKCSIHGISERLVGDFVNRNLCCGKCSSKNNNQHLVKIYKKDELSKMFPLITVLEDGRGKEKVKCNCKIHGDFKAKPIHFVKSKTGCCAKCGYILAQSKMHNEKTPEYYLKKSYEKYGDRFEYPNDLNYITNSRTLLTILCKKHNLEFKYDLNNFLNPNSNAGCPECFKESAIINLPKCNVSKLEIEIREYIQSLYKDEIILSSKSILPNNLEIDIALPNIKLAFEINGIYWHNSKRKPKNYHKDKSDFAESLGYKLIHIYEDEWHNSKDIVKSRIMNLLNKNVEKIYARQCEVREISAKESSNFFKENHLQGNVNASIKIGLFYNNNLVSVMSFGKLRKSLGNISKDSYYELLRLASKLNTTIIGGANKMFKYFIKKLNPKYILSFADRSWSNYKNNIYLQLGFSLIGKTSPGYYYYDIGSKITKYHRFNFRKSELIKLGYDESLTEFEITDKMGLIKVYNSGNLKFEWKQKEEL